jgi:hypothetical protein
VVWLELELELLGSLFVGVVGVRVVDVGFFGHELRAVIGASKHARIYVEPRAEKYKLSYNFGYWE